MTCCLTTLLAFSRRSGSLGIGGGGLGGDGGGGSPQGVQMTRGPSGTGGYFALTNSFASRVRGRARPY